MKDAFGQTVIVRLPKELRQRLNQDLLWTRRMAGRMAPGTRALRLLELGLDAIQTAKAFERGIASRGGLKAMRRLYSTTQAAVGQAAAARLAARRGMEQRP